MNLERFANLVAFFESYPGREDAPIHVEEINTRTRRLKPRITCSKKLNKTVTDAEVAEYAEMESDEMNKKFSFKCRYSPEECAAVFKSYGSDEKASIQMKHHLLERHIGINATDHPVAKSMFLKQVKNSKPISENPCKWSIDVPEPSKKFNSIKNVAQIRKARRKSLHPKRKTDFKEKTVFNFVECLITPDGIVSCNFDSQAKHIQDHDYFCQKPSLQKADHNYQRVETKFDLNEHLNRNLLPNIIIAPRFPLVYNCSSLEAVQIVDIQSNNDLVHPVKPHFLQSSSKVFSEIKKQIDGKKVSKISPRLGVGSVLECVENRFASKSDVASRQKIYRPDDIIENSENMEKTVEEIVMENIKILKEQRKKKKRKDSSGRKIIKCEVCRKSFTANTSLFYHYNSHLKIKPYTCNICKRTFTRQHSLKYHLMIHSNKTRFNCIQCGRLFRHPSHYKEHLRRHSDEEPFSCDICPYKFKTRNSYKRHLKVHHQKLLTSEGIVPIPS